MLTETNVLNFCCLSSSPNFQMLFWPHGDFIVSGSTVDFVPTAIDLVFQSEVQNRSGKIFTGIKIENHVLIITIRFIIVAFKLMAIANDKGDGCGHNLDGTDCAVLPFANPSLPRMSRKGLSDQKSSKEQGFLQHFRTLAQLSAENTSHSRGLPCLKRDDYGQLYQFNR